MKILSLSLRNFMCVSECDLSFRDGINVLHGDNGQGKSTIFEAIAYCLIDRTKGDSWKDYIKTGEDSFSINLVIEMPDKNTMVFEYGGKASGSSSSKKITYLGQTYINSECLEFLKSKFDQDMLKIVLFSLQDGEPISAMKPADRRMVFKKLFNSDFPDILTSIAEDKATEKTIETELTIDMKALQQKNYPFARIEDIDDSELANLRAELATSQEVSVLLEKKKMYVEKLQQYNSKTQEYNNLIEKKDALIAKKDSLNANYISCTKALDAEQETLNKLIKDVENKDIELEKIRSSNQESIVSVQSNITTLMAKSSDYSTKKLGVHADLIINKKYKETRESGICPQCGQTCTHESSQELDSVIEALSTELATYTKLLSDTEEELTTQELEVVRLQNEIKAYSDACVEAKRNKSNQDMKVTMAQNNVANSLVQLTAMDGQISDVDSMVVRVNSEMSTLSTWVQANKIEENIQEVRNPNVIQKQIESILASITANEEQEKLNNRLKEERDKDLEKIKELSDRINAVQLKIKDLEVVQKIFEIEFPSYINLQACEILQEYMNNFMAQTKQGFQVKLQQDKKGINFYYKASDEPAWTNVKMISGFESALLTLAFKCSVAYAYGSDLIILDEPDGPASEDNSMRLFSTISGINIFKQMFVITHKLSAMEFFKENGARIYHVENGNFSLE